MKPDDEPALGILSSLQDQMDHKIGADKPYPVIMTARYMDYKPF